MTTYTPYLRDPASGVFRPYSDPQAERAERTFTDDDLAGTEEREIQTSDRWKIKAHVVLDDPSFALVPDPA